MPRAKKKTTTNQVTEARVARLFVDLLEVYKNSCKSELISELNNDQVVSLSRKLEQQSDVIKSKCFDQVNLMFKE